MLQTNSEDFRAVDYRPYQYLNTVSNEIYMDVPLGNQFPQDYAQDLAKYAARDAFLSGKSAITSNYSYFSIVRSGQPPVAVFAKCARKTRAQSVCRFTQAAGWAWNDGALIRNNFNSIFDFGFYTEAEADAAVARTAVVPFGEGSDRAPAAYPIRIDPTALRAVVYGVYLRWQRADPLIRIGVPASVPAEDYNAYVLAAVREIYSYFPAVLKVECGFCSYLPKGREKGAQRLHLGFVPEEEAQGDDGVMYLDGSSTARYQEMAKSTNIASQDKFINHILSLKDPVERKAFLENVFQDVESGDVTAVNPNSYSAMGSALLLMMERGSSDKQVARWIRFYNEQESYPASLLGGLKDAASLALTPQVLSEYLERVCPVDKSFENVVDQTGFLRAYVNDYPRCREAVWGTVENYLNKTCGGNAQKAEAACAMLEKHESPLSRLAPEAYAACLQRWKQDAADQVCNAALDQIRALTGSRAQVRAQGSALWGKATEKLAAYLPREVISQRDQQVRTFISNKNLLSAEKDMDDLEKLPAARKKELEARIQAAEAIAKDLEAEPESESRKLSWDRLQGILDRDRAALSALKGTADFMIAEMQKLGNYFHCLQYLDANQDKLVKMDKQSRLQLDEELARLRPAKEHAYRDAFSQSHNGQSLTAGHLAACKPLEVQAVLKDMDTFHRNEQYHISAADNATHLRDKIHARQTLVETTAGNKRIKPEFGGICLDADTWKQILSLGRSSAKRPDAKDLQEVVNLLAQKQMLSVGELNGICRMYLDLDCELEDLSRLILTGAFADAQSRDYTAAYELLYQGMGAKAFEKTMTKAAEEAEPDKTAHRALKNFLRAKQPADTGKKPNVLLIVLLSVLFVALAAFAGFATWKWISAEADRESIDQQREELQSQVNRSILFFQSGFQKYDAVVRNAWTGDNGQTYADRYTQHRADDVVMQINGDDITWNEYFFWESYFIAVANTNAETIPTSQDVADSVNGALVLCHSQLQESFVLPVDPDATVAPDSSEPSVPTQPTELPTEPVAVPTVPATEAPVPEPDSTTPSVPTQPTQPTEPAPTLADCMDQVIATAKAAFDHGQANLEAYLLTQREAYDASQAAQPTEAAPTEAPAATEASDSNISEGVTVPDATLTPDAVPPTDPVTNSPDPTVAPA